ncbi:hypothetical protein PAMP_001027 [Pampus punctatissimus]
MAQETNRSQAPLLCTTGCGFYGNPRNNGMCSVCYKDFLQRQNSNGRVNIPDTPEEDLYQDIVYSMTGCGYVPRNTPVKGCRKWNKNIISNLNWRKYLKSSCRAVRAASVNSEQKGQCSAGSSGTASSSQRTVLKNSPSVKNKERKHKKRKLEDPDETIDVERASVSEVSVDSPAETEEKPKGKKKRCFTCRKKVGLTGFDCRCGNVFCSIHRYSDVHNCTFDYKADAAERIRKDNPVIVGEKIHKI